MDQAYDLTLVKETGVFLISLGSLTPPSKIGSLVYYTANSCVNGRAGVSFLVLAFPDLDGGTVFTPVNC